MSSLRQVLEHVITGVEVDEAGHLNIRRYADLAEQCATSGVGGGRIDSALTRHLREQRLGDRLRGFVGLLDVAGNGAQCHVELRNQDDVVACTSLLHVTWTPSVRDQTELVRRDMIDWPEIGRPRTLALTPMRALDPEAGRTRSFEVWSERTVGASECDRDGVFAGGPSSLARGPYDGTIGASAARGQFATRWLFTMADGRRLAFVNAESRRVVFVPPGAGARIRSMDADIAFGRKYRIRREWTVDLDTWVTYAAGEFVDLMLDLDARRVVAVPDAVRTDLAGHFHPDLGDPFSGDRRPTETCPDQSAEE